MAVYESRYRPYNGELTPLGSRWLILVRFGWREIFRGKLFSLFFLLCFINPLLLAAYIYLHNNINLIHLSIPGLQRLLEEMVRQSPIDGSTFFTMLRFQTSLSFLVVLAAAPSVIAPDLRNNGLALYLSRPLTRGEYTLGKLVALLWPISLITWIAGLFCFVLQSFLAGGSWLAANLRIGMGLLVGGLTWTVALALIGLTVSAWVKWRPVARVVLLVVLFMPVAFAGAVEGSTGSWWGELISPTHLIRRTWEGLFGLEPHSGMPLAAAWTMLILGMLLCLALLRRRVRAYEVVR